MATAKIQVREDIKPRIRTQYKRAGKPDGEVNILPSLTVPDQSMEIPELLARYHRNLPLTGERVPMYQGDENLDPLTDYLPNAKDLDLADLHDELEAIQRRQAERLREAHEAARKKAKEDYDAELENLVNARIAERDKKSKEVKPDPEK